MFILCTNKTKRDVFQKSHYHRLLHQKGFIIYPRHLVHSPSHFCPFSSSTGLFPKYQLILWRLRSIHICKIKWDFEEPEAVFFALVFIHFMAYMKMAWRGFNICNDPINVYVQHMYWHEHEQEHELEHVHVHVHFYNVTNFIVFLS